MLLEISGEITPEGKKGWMEPKQKQYPVVDVTGDRSKVWCCKEQYFTGTWNVRSTNQGELEVVKQEMARVNVDILGISKLKWTGMGEFNSNDHCIYYCGEESLRRNGIAIMVNKRVQNAVLECNLCFWTVMFEKTLVTPLDCKEIQPVHPKGDQSWVFIGRTDAEANSSTLAISCEELTHWKRPWCWEELRAGGDGNGRGWDG